MKKSRKYRSLRKGKWIYTTGNNTMWVFSKRTMGLCEKRGWDDLPF